MVKFPKLMKNSIEKFNISILSLSESKGRAGVRLRRCCIRRLVPRDVACITCKEWIEILKFWIQFFTNFGNFTDFSSKFCKISGIFNEFRHFGTCSRNPDKISSKFRWEIAFFMKKSEISIEISIFNLAKLWLIFLWNFEVWAVQRYANLVDLEKCWKMRLLSLS